jgi:hypothetical protein
MDREAPGTKTKRPSSMHKKGNGVVEPKAKSHRVRLFPLALSFHFASSSHCSFNIGHVRSGNSIGSLIGVTLWTSIWIYSLWISCV